MNAQWCLCFDLLFQFLSQSARFIRKTDTENQKATTNFISARSHIVYILNKSVVEFYTFLFLKNDHPVPDYVVAESLCRTHRDVYRTVRYLLKI